MNVLVTGSEGFVGRNLVENLKNIKNGKNKTRPNLVIDNIFEFDKDDTLEELDKYCSKADFVFNLAGVNRPKNEKEFEKGNFGFAKALLDYLKKHENRCPVMLSSSIQATLSGRFGTSEYGLSKKMGEELFFEYQKETGAKVLVYRFPNLAGKWIRPNYNSAIATFCHNIANDLPITVNDPSVEMHILFIDDLIEEMYDALEGKEHHCNFDGVDMIPDPKGKYCMAMKSHHATLGDITELLYKFSEQPKTLVIPDISKDSLEYKLYSMYLSYLPKEKIAFDLKMNVDERGSFTELIKTNNAGQISVNVCKPGVTKGQHWHNTKWELFIVVSGHGKIQERKIGSDEVIEFEVSGEKIRAVHMLPGYTHNIVNLSETEDLVTVMWANEQFDSDRPDTFFEEV